jgi:hypothetical protein
MTDRTTRAVIDAKADGGNAVDRGRTVRVTRYAGGWTITIAIGDSDPERPGRASAVLNPAGARAVALELLQGAALAEEWMRRRSDRGGSS